MKKPLRPDQPREISRRSAHHTGKPGAGAKEGKWAFNLASENLFTLGETGNARRVAYRTATGELRFLPRQA